MAFGTSSKIFTSFITDVFNNTSALDMNADTPKVALFNDTITPSQTVASASTAFGAGVWASGQVYDGANWATGGVVLASITSDFSSNVYKFDAADTVSTTSTATLAAVFGCLVYDDTSTTPVADQGMCYNAFGGSNSVTSGTFTVSWNVAGIFNITA